MIFFKRLLFFVPFHFITMQANAQTSDYLKTCRTKQVKPLEKNDIRFSFKENLNELEHSFEPWQQTAYSVKGSIWLNATQFIKDDTMTNGKMVYFSKTQSDTTSLLFLDYGDKELFPVTKTMFQERMLKSARYSPAPLIQYFFENKIGQSLVHTADQTCAVYQTKINKNIVTLRIRKKDSALTEATVLSDDELFGDVLSTFIYSDYRTLNGLSFPESIRIEKINGKVTDRVQLSGPNTTQPCPTLLSVPANYTLAKEKTVNPELRDEPYNTHIHFIDLKHTDDKAMVVEFADFLLVAEAPLNSSNGDILIAEAHKIAPGKPIRYFVFSHYHPHYLGGIRSFVHEGAKVICTKEDDAYVNYLIHAAHTLQPDSLQIQPKPLQLEEMKESKTISDGKYEMKIFFIGPKSAHSNDYLVYYFPAEKLLFEGDLIWIPKTGAITQASNRQAGLYQAVKDLGLTIQTIIQSWPVSDYGVKTIIPFEELEQSMHVSEKK
jgi:glyoxylase-like metal-dependent hydrolase (beta-lactamase superfamily II)